MSSRNPTSLRGRIESAKENVEKMISTDEYSAHFVGFGDPPCPDDRDAANDWIKDRIRLYVKTWVLPELDFVRKKITRRDKK